MIRPEDRDMKSGTMDRMRLWHDGIIGFIIDTVNRLNNNPVQLLVDKDNLYIATIA